MKEIIARKAFDIRYQIKYEDETNPNNNTLVYISREDFKHDEQDCYLIHIKIFTQQAKNDETSLQKEFEKIACETINLNFQQPLAEVDKICEVMIQENKIKS